VTRLLQNSSPESDVEPNLRSVLHCQSSVDRCRDRAKMTSAAGRISLEVTDERVGGTHSARGAVCADRRNRRLFDGQDRRRSPFTHNIEGQSAGTLPHRSDEARLGTIVATEAKALCARPEWTVSGSCAASVLRRQRSSVGHPL
jgi:hypothetical protein